MARIQPSRSLLDWALEYASLGWPVHPLVERDKRPLTSNGLLDANIDPEMVRAWWTARPNANIGLRTGDAFDVIDVDGDVGKASLSEVGPGSGPGPTSFTGNNGIHFLIQPTKSQNRAGILPKVDFRGHHGYIVAPPSIHPNGNTYTWDPERDYHLSIPVAPEWLIPLLVPYADKPRVIYNRESFDPAESIVALCIKNDWKMYRDGPNRIKMHCPLGLHTDSSPSFTVYLDQNTWHCYGACNEGGGIYWLEQRLTQARHRA